MKSGKERFFYRGDEKKITENAAALVIVEGQRAIERSGRFSLVLAGGTSPRSLYQQLAREFSANPYLAQKTWFFWGDERCTPADHPDSNYRMAKESLLVPSGIPEDHIFRMPASKTNTAEAAREYETLIRTFFLAAAPLSSNNFPLFDLILLGMGEDGHTASLFADNPEALHEKKQWVVAVNAQHGKPPGERLTLTLPAINSAHNILFFIIGKEKSQLAERIFHGSERGVPASLIEPCNGKLFWFTAQQ